MDDFRRLLLFFALSLAFIIGWTQLRQALFPAPVRPPAPIAEIEPDEDADSVAEIDAVEADDNDADPRGVAETEVVLPSHPAETVVLGGDDIESGYLQRVTLTSAGAAVESIELLDERYRELGDRDAPLRVVGHDNDRERARTLATELEGFPVEVPADIDWELLKTEADPERPGVLRKATFGLTVGGVTALKTYRLAAGDLETRDVDAAGYRLEVTVAFRNASDDAREVIYELHGPTGLPLENLDVGRKFRELELSFFGDDGSVTNDTVMAKPAAEQAARNAFAIANGRDPEQWRSPVRYAGVEVQYFASLLFPQRGDASATEKPITDAVLPVVTAEDEEGKVERNDVSFLLRSVPLALGPGEEKLHRYSLVTAPKRPEIFEPIGASAVLDLGWFWFVSEAMLWLLGGLHSLGMPYGIAIIGLTVIVRCCMMPLTLKQVRSAARMKELQPKLEELKKKHGDDRQAMGQAQMKLFAEHGINPLAGCLPLFLQLPIFIGLYNALNNSVDLRMAEFLWIDNLAAPDHLMFLGFRPDFWLPLPFFGWYEVRLTWLNLLPLLTVVLFYVQQKLFMPPATTPEQELQFKMMGFMTLFMGLFFYSVPAGLCVYFISSSLWGITERKLLAGARNAPPPPPKAKKSKAGKADGKPGGFFGKLLEAAEEAQKQAELNPNRPDGGGRGRRAKNR